VIQVGGCLAIFYDAPRRQHEHLGRDIGLAWLDLPLTPSRLEIKVALEEITKNMITNITN